MQDFWLTLADDEFYVPMEHIADPGTRYAPSTLPPSWSSSTRDCWTVWTAPGLPSAEQGWKVHVSSTLPTAAATLDVVAAACAEHGVAFKHLTAKMFFLALHHKHGPRVQAGKFCALYPADADAARRLMRTLAAELAGFAAPYVLTDRRWADSPSVYYRYGAFAARHRLRADGGTEALVRDGSGELAVDERRPYFTLPAGITDPFAATPARSHSGPVLLDGRYRVRRVIRHSNAGGSYDATDEHTGDRVFVKEARAHNGLTWDGDDAQHRLRREHRTLVEVNDVAPGSCPRPLAYFRSWEHEFMVSEYVPGTPLTSWVGTHNVLIRPTAARWERTAYLARCERVLRSLRERLDALHAAGYRFGDLGPGNVLVDEDDSVRLVDFEATGRRADPERAMGTDGFFPPAELRESGVDSDDFGYSALALLLLFPLHKPMEFDGAGRAELLARDLGLGDEDGAELWRTALRYYPRRSMATGTGFDLPSTAELDDQPTRCLWQLADALAAGILAMARPDNVDWLFPPSPRGYSTNTTCVAYGSAGVLHALHHARVPIPAGVLARFRRDALAARDRYAPGLHVGTAGLAWVLAELGRHDEATELLGSAARHEHTRTLTTVEGGAAGVGLAQLQLFRITGEDKHLSGAAEAGERILDLGDDGLGAALPGLLRGRSGVALFLHHLSTATGDERFRTAGLGMLHAELDGVVRTPAGNLSFLERAEISRQIPYLYSGSAGVAMVLHRYVAATGDERCAALLPELLADCAITSAVDPGLYLGLAGMAYVWQEWAAWCGTAETQHTATALATGLAKYAIRHPAGVRLLGGAGTRYAADLHTGSAGVLLALNRVLRGPANQFFTLDPIAEEVNT